MNFIARTPKTLDILARLRTQFDEAQEKYDATPKGTPERKEAFDLVETAAREHNAVALKLKEPTV